MTKKVHILDFLCIILHDSDFPITRKTSVAFRWGKEKK